VADSAISEDANFQTEFGDIPDAVLLEELKVRLQESSAVAIFTYCYKWYYVSLVADKAEEDFRLFEETGELPFYVKRHLFSFRKEKSKR
jgi:hypothetical protein